MVFVALILLVCAVCKMIERWIIKPEPEVSRNRAPYRRHSGPSWEQDAPYAECFDQQQEDDL